MLNSFPRQASSDIQGLLLTFDEDLNGIASAAIVEAAENFRRGLVEGQSLDYAPSSARFCAEARRIHDLLPYRNRKALPAPAANDRPYGDDARAKARMRLKMPMFAAAMAKGPAAMNDLAKANAEGVESMILLAASWGIAIPEQLDGATDDEWISARNRALHRMEMDPPPFLRGRPELMGDIRAGRAIPAPSIGAGEARR